MQIDTSRLSIPQLEQLLADVEQNRVELSAGIEGAEARRSRALVAVELAGEASGDEVEWKAAGQELAEATACRERLKQAADDGAKTARGLQALLAKRKAAADIEQRREHLAKAEALAGTFKAALQAIIIAARGMQESFDALGRVSQEIYAELDQAQVPGYEGTGPRLRRNLIAFMLQEVPGLAETLELRRDVRLLDWQTGFQVIADPETWRRRFEAQQHQVAA